MKTRSRKNGFSILLRINAASFVLLPAVAALTSCTKGDEELQRQLIELRGAVEAKNKSVEQLQAQVAEMQGQGQRSTTTTVTSSTSSGTSAEELAKARAQIADLEQRLAAASTNSAASPQTGKLDLDDMAGKLEEDLTRKAKQLRELVQRQSPSSRIDEISLKSIEYPPQLVTPFTSAITFTVTVGTAAPMRLMFPVTADLGGSWKLPTPDEIQKAYKAAQEQPPGIASTGTQTAPSPKARGKSSPQPVATGGGGGARMTQRADGVFVFDWGDGAGAGGAQQNRQPQQGYTQPAPPSGGPQTVNNFVPPGKDGGAQPQPAPGPRTPAATPQAPNVPPPVMPIVGDRVIRFND